MKTITLNGLEWSSENLEINGETYFDFNEAQEAAKSIGMRLPTKEEFEALCELPNTWEPELNGRWFAENVSDLGDPEKSLFLPAMGYRYGSGLGSVSSGGYYWSATPLSSTHGYYLSFRSTSVSPSGTNRRYFGFAARCVAE